MVNGLEDDDLAVPGHVVADVALASDPERQADGSVTVVIEALTVEDQLSDGAAQFGQRIPELLRRVGVRRGVPAAVEVPLDALVQLAGSGGRPLPGLGRSYSRGHGAASVEKERFAFRRWIVIECERRRLKPRQPEFARRPKPLHNLHTAA